MADIIITNGIVVTMTKHASPLREITIATIKLVVMTFTQDVCVGVGAWNHFLDFATLPVQPSDRHGAENPLESSRDKMLVFDSPRTVTQFPRIALSHATPRS